MNTAAVHIPRDISGLQNIAGLPSAIKPQTVSLTNILTSGHTLLSTQLANLSAAHLAPTGLLPSLANSLSGLIQLVSENAVLTLSKFPLLTQNAETPKLLNRLHFPSIPASPRLITLPSLHALQDPALKTRLELLIKNRALDRADKQQNNNSVFTYLRDIATGRAPLNFANTSAPTNSAQTIDSASTTPRTNNFFTPHSLPEQLSSKYSASSARDRLPPRRVPYEDLQDKNQTKSSTTLKHRRGYLQQLVEHISQWLRRSS